MNKEQQGKKQLLMDGKSSLFSIRFGNIILFSANGILNVELIKTMLMRMSLRATPKLLSSGSFYPKSHSDMIYVEECRKVCYPGYPSYQIHACSLALPLFSPLSFLLLFCRSVFFLSAFVVANTTEDSLKIDPAGTLKILLPSFTIYSVSTA